jgi:YfiH family protein
MFLTSRELIALNGIRHGFFTRKGGVSTGIFRELNCGFGTYEGADVVAVNRRLIAHQIGVSPERLLSVRQVHGPGVVTVEGPWDVNDRPVADAMVTDRPEIALGILTADCVPVLFADAVAGVVGAAHSGWKGAFAGVLSETLNAMERLGASRANTVVAIGPAIAQASYEVDAAFREHFLAQDSGHVQFFTELDADRHCRFNLPGYVYELVTRADVSRIDWLKNDTYAEEADFYSYRRSTHRGEDDYGRQLSVICLERETP